MLVKIHREGLVNVRSSDFKFWKSSISKVSVRRSVRYAFVYIISHNSFRAANVLQELIIVESVTAERILLLVDAIILAIGHRAR